MAYVNKDKKAKIKAALDNVLKGVDVKVTLAVRDHSTIVCTIHKGSIDFISNYKENSDKTDVKYIDVNTYYLQRQFSGKVLELIEKITVALNTGNYDNSDIQSDYFDVGHYVDLNIGRWDKPYQLVIQE